MTAAKVSIDDRAMVEGLEDRAHDPCSHVANGHRIEKLLGDQLMFVEGIGWHVFGPPWRHDELAARKLCQKLGKIIADEAAQMAIWVAQADGKAEREQRQAAMERRFKWASESESARCIDSSLRMAAARINCRADALDADPMLLGLQNGVLELNTGRMRPHRQPDLITKTAGCDFIANATAPTWDRFIGEMVPDDDVREFLQRLFGYCLTGKRGEHLLPIFHGSGANGKSTLLGALQTMLGEYAATAAPGLMIQRHGTEHPTGLADLQGRRLVIASESGEHSRLNEELVKGLTGGDRITARRMRMDFYTFDPTHQLALQTNHRPKISGTDHGIWRRVKLVPFDVTIPPERRDTCLPEKLRGELPGILNWCLAGLRKYQSHGLNEPEAIRAATSQYRDASDQLAGFIDENCVVSSGFTSAAGELYASYARWCDEAGERPRSQRDFGIALSERGFEQMRGSGGKRRWRGIGLTSSDASDASDAPFGLVASRGRDRAAYTEKSVTHVTHVTSRVASNSDPTAADAYRAAKDGGI